MFNQEENILKKKKKQLKPKKVVLDEQGQEWEVVDKKRAFVEVEEGEEEEWGAHLYNQIDQWPNI